MQKTILGILLLLTLLALAVALMGSDRLVEGMVIHKNGRIARDMNYDHRPDYVETWSHGELVKIEQDSDADGRYESTTYLRNNEPYRLEIDTNHDGRLDYRETWGAGGAHRTEVERNGRWETVPAH